ncbi:imidazole glycerol phosphate synthase subunit HisH [Pseudoalteromonas tunicata]|jgi:glutamine amidotransferase|uniref:Imidazole glycerol phosphate synthase subunit HisH n=1 Tax=Pseudoalteromonas tunicata D2 TaxID=87626 RepID=A4C476_9GAMM|nr:imidazole glycerol phosphate synthase subunit HisH [Pseudoalteromonas tunicata]ATC97161.1 glutamine amidotransferase [Pseudoalteromonas tunicata]AXT33265.1 imidazole glycerol phosphate synthase subunit HisH [Pseudoalteromonas tunicata]EAR30358.1 Imidazole glycerol phosphate synthase subunit hisH [Pseudoalteromonas tunicata D2]MDP4984757.1 imidazole glycerol phosphate synthase subunit HisH [Pseudoalteromonas tunicata]
MIAIINTGCANINSVRFAFERLNCPTQVISQPEQLAHFDRAVLPGVGHASVAMKRLIDGGWQSAITEYQKPLMGICLGMQLLCESTEEGHIDTLGLIPGKVSLLETGQLTSPHMGWNNLHVESAHALTQGLLASDQVYFVHSFAHSVNSATLVSGEYGERFSAIVAKDNFAGMQFHPERSAKVGARLLTNFIEWRI